MIRSTNETLGEYDLIREPDHIALVWGALQRSLPEYWERFVQTARRGDPASRLAGRFGSAARPAGSANARVIAHVFEDAVGKYEKEAEKYRRFFNPSALDEYHDDPNSFKQGLAREVPVIANTLRQRSAELKEWQMHFRAARAKDLLATFSNVTDYIADWSSSHPLSVYSTLDSPAAFDLDSLDNDESMYLINVIGMGIKSIVLYHLDPARLPARGRIGLYALYFLSEKKNFGLPSKTSEFLMINDVSPASDGSIVMDQNYYYPYGTYSMYALRVYRWICERGVALGYTPDDSMRYVIVDRFFQGICDEHSEDVKTMRAHERFEFPG